MSQIRIRIWLHFQLLMKRFRLWNYRFGLMGNVLNYNLCGYLFLSKWRFLPVTFSMADFSWLFGHEMCYPCFYLCWFIFKSDKKTAQFTLIPNTFFSEPRSLIDWYSRKLISVSYIFQSFRRFSLSSRTVFATLRRCVVFMHFEGEVQGSVLCFVIFRGPSPLYGKWLKCREIYFDGILVYLGSPTLRKLGAMPSWRNFC
jgi:hypothetical protein